MFWYFRDRVRVVVWCVLIFLCNLFLLFFALFVLLSNFFYTHRIRFYNVVIVWSFRFFSEIVFLFLLIFWRFFIVSVDWRVVVRIVFIFAVLVVRVFFVREVADLWVGGIARIAFWTLPTEWDAVCPIRLVWRLVLVGIWI